MCSTKCLRGKLNHLFTAFLICIFTTSAFAALQIDPADGFTSAGPEGGPFAPSQKTYLLTNTGTSSLYWGVVQSAAWIDCSPEWGLLEAGSSVEVTISINSSAESLAVGDYQDTVVFTDLANGLDYTRTVTLNVNSNVSGPVAWWKLDGDATDSSGNDHHGSAFGDPNWVAEGKVDGAVRLDGINDFISILANDDLHPAFPFSVSLWMNAADPLSSSFILQSSPPDNDTYYAGFVVTNDSSGCITAGYRNGGPAGPASRHDQTGTTVLQAGVWYHVAAVIGGYQKIKLYVNGVSEESYTSGTADSIHYSQNPFFLGARKAGTSLFDGLLDDVRLYNRALSQAEIAELAGIGPLIVSPADSFTSSGEPGGPFAPAYKDYTVTNSSDQILYWGVDPLPDWLDTNVSFGSLDPNASTTVRVFLTEAAKELDEALYTSALTIHNLSTMQDPVIRNVDLDVQKIRGIWAHPKAFNISLTEGNQLSEVLTVGNDGAETVNFSMRSRIVAGTSPAAAQQENQTPATASNLQPQKQILDVKTSLKHRHKEGEVLVRFAPDHNRKYPDKERQKQKLSRVLPKSGIVKQFNSVPGLSVVKLPSGITVQDALVTLNAAEDVLYVHPNYRVYADTLPNDSRFGELWGLHNTGQSGGRLDADIDASEAWDVSTGSESVVVAVIDTGVDYNHEDLAGNMWNNPAEMNGLPGVDDDQNGFIDDIYGYDFCNSDSNPMDDHYHGTHCAGTIAAVGNNGKGVTGVCWNVKIMALKFLDSGGDGWTSDAVECVEYARLMGAKVMSNSWGGGPYAQALKDAIDAAGQAGSAFVAAAGNDGVNNDTYPQYPSSYTSDNLISVLATDRSDNRSSFSNYGLVSVDLGAPGSAILSCQPGNRYQFLNGTSMATPHVSGACAMLWSVNPLLAVSEIKDLLLDSADPLPALTGKCVSGGRLNLGSAVLKTHTPWISFDIEQGQIDPAASMPIQVTFSAAELSPGEYNAEIIINSDDAAHPQLTIPVSLVVLPDLLEITPENSFDPNGIEGGPFTPESMTYTLLNTAPDPLEWSVQWHVDWLDVEPAAGVLEAGQAVEVSVSTNSNTELLPPALYEDSLVFNNLTTGSKQQRNARLFVHPTDKFTQVFTADFDLANHSIILRPDPDKPCYASCVEGDSIQDFITDSAGGTFLSLADDDYIEVLLTDEKQIPFYGQLYDRVYIGSNGYLTFGQGDTEHEPVLENHFQLPRIAPLFADLTPVNDHSVSYQQTDDRFAVIYSRVPAFGNKTSSNSFQVEVFFADGTIRLSYLEIDAAASIVGLSEGIGKPGLFEESDFSSYLECCDCGDLNGDSQVEFSDLCEFAAAWLQAECIGPDWCGRIDLDRSGNVDFADLALIAEYWRHAEYAWSQPEFLLELNGKTWGSPILLPELNSTNDKAAQPCLSLDGLTMYFNRYIPSLGMSAVVEATRLLPSGPFTSERVLTELNQCVTDVGCTSPWISSDNLRLYYREDISATENRIKMASRATVDDPWVPVRTFDELHENGYRGTNMSLTADELTIVWHSRSRPGTGGIDLWMATRISKDSEFGNIRELHELNTPASDGGPHISSDGLTLYFVADRDSSGNGDIYRAKRFSQSDLFAGIERIEFPHYDQTFADCPYVVPDETLLFYSDAAGIYTTSFASHPTEYPSWNTCLSADQLNACFARYVPENGGYCIIEAKRTGPDALFSTERSYPQLNATAAGPSSAWISNDKLRLYFYEAGLIKMSQRSNVEEDFTAITATFPELKGDGVSASPCLTDDECTIVFHSTQSGSVSGSQVALWTATRTSANEPFADKRPLDEINTSKGHSNPWLAGDGKRLYFSSNRDSDSDYDIFVAERNSTTELFGPVRKMTDGCGNATKAPYISPDGKTLYFYDETAQYKGTWQIRNDLQVVPCLPK